MPNPLVSLGVGSGTHAFQTRKMMTGLEQAMEKLKPSLVLVLGDADSTLAGALAAVKLKAPLAHVGPLLLSLKFCFVTKSSAEGVVTVLRIHA